MDQSLGSMMWSWIQKYCNQYPLESESLIGQCHFVEAIANPFARDTLPGHITASGIVIRDHQILLVHHRYIQEWFQPGGHVDAGELPLDAAIRELHEETGWRTSPIASAISLEIPLDIDVHQIPENPLKQEPGHLHIDFAYLLHADLLESATDPEPNQWVDIHSIEAPRLKRVIAKYLSLDQ